MWANSGRPGSDTDGPSPRKPIRQTFPDCCAPAASGAASTAPRPVTKARRFIAPTPGRRDGRPYEGSQQGASRHLRSTTRIAEGPRLIAEAVDERGLWLRRPPDVGLPRLYNAPGWRALYLPGQRSRPTHFAALEALTASSCIVHDCPAGQVSPCGSGSAAASPFGLLAEVTP